MARKKSRRRLAPLPPEEILTSGQRLLEALRPYLKWLIGVGVVLGLTLGGWGVYLYRQQSREVEAQAALDRLRSRLHETEKAGEVLPELARLNQEYAGTLAGDQALLFKGHLLYQTKKYADAAKTYEELLAALRKRDPGGLAGFVTESLSYCYEALGEYQRAAQVLQPLAEQAKGEYRGEILGRLALLFQQAGKPQDARRCLEQQLQEPLDPGKKAFVREKLAALEAKPPEGGR